MQENIIREILEAEMLVDDRLCVNGCGNVEYEKSCETCGMVQDLKFRSNLEKISDTVELILLTSTDKE